MVHFTKINHTPPAYLMMQDIGREATPKLATTNCLKYLKTTLIMECGGVGLRNYMMYCLKKLMNNNRGFGKARHFLLS